MEAAMAVVTDPVCGMEVETESAEHTSEYKGAKYYFCSKGCKLDFEEDPERYLDTSYTPSGMEPH
jgi:YHS domain-containing protein